MVEDIIFNEPGEESKRGTVQGTKQNNGYCNVVKYGTAKYAILENLRNLPAGFEQAIIASFFVKKDVILSDLRQWIEQADT
jgi:baculoviral IAP repeat-containing protein 6